VHIGATGLQSYLTVTATLEMSFAKWNRTSNAKVVSSVLTSLYLWRTIYLYKTM
jgi:hypothetical protein